MHRLYWYIFPSTSSLIGIGFVLVIAKGKRKIRKITCPGMLVLSNGTLKFSNFSNMCIVQ